MTINATQLVKHRQITDCPLEFLYCYIHSETLGSNGEYSILGIGTTELDSFILLNRNKHYIGNSSTLAEVEELAARKGLKPLETKTPITQGQLDTFWFAWRNIKTDTCFISFVALLFPLTKLDTLEVIRYQLKKSKT